jgi:hypothetical protein
LRSRGYFWPLSEETGEGTKLPRLFSVLGRGAGRSLKTEYSFIRHVPIAIAKSMSHVSGCAMMSRDAEDRTHENVCLYLRCAAEREQSAIKAGLPPDRR